MPTWLPLATTLLFLGFAVGLRSLLHKLRYGTFGIVLFAGDRRQRARDAGLVALWAILLAQSLVVWHRGVDPADLDGSLPNAASWPWTGGSAMFAGLLLILWSEVQLGASWRVGIEQGARPGLVTTGVYACCRNPIFLGVLLFLCGYLACVPTWVSLLQLVLALLGVRQQALAEEQWLLATYGEDYRAYAARVGRFLPGIGRLQ